MSFIKKKNAVIIDGSYGEGGGQVLRTALALSSLLGRPAEIMNIRRARKKPGLQPQHLTAVKAAAQISHALVQGAGLLSTSVVFSPGVIEGGSFIFDVSEEKESAGSTSLVLQTIMLPLLSAEHPSIVKMNGGTHVPWSPSFHYIQKVFFPMLSRIGASADLKIDRWGWYPVGGGKIIATISAETEFKPVAISERGKLVRVLGISAISNLPRNIGVRQRDRAVQALSQHGIDADIEIITAPSPGKGTYVFILAEFENITAGFDALGAIGKRAEEVAEEACHALFEYMSTNGALDPYLADQIISYAALANGTSEFTTSRITQHLLTNIWVIKQFIDVDIIVEGRVGEPGKIRVSGS